MPTAPERASWNLSAWALGHRSLVRYLIVVLLAGGLWTYFQLGRAEDPSFAFRVMIVRAGWPGATAAEVEQQVTDRLEKKLQETPWLYYVRSYSRAGEATIFVVLQEGLPPPKIAEAWYQVRKKLTDVRPTLPEGVVGPAFNDEFGDTFGSMYAFTGDGYSYAELKDVVDRARQELLRLPDVSKVEPFGVQDEKVYVEIPSEKLQTLGISPLVVIDTLRAQNAMTPAGAVHTDRNTVLLRVTGEFESVDSIREIGIRANGRMLRLGDIAHVWRGFADPPVVKARWQGREAILLGVSMARGGDIIKLGRALDQTFTQLQRELPAGMEVHQVHDQPAVVERSIRDFMSSLAEALTIVLLVSFFSLGWRTGIVVALSIPLVLAMTFIAMHVAGIDLQRVSLGALIIALGLLVDDAIISVEMMATKLEAGWDRFRAATFAFTSTAFPMLTGTLITAAGFLPVGLAQSNAGEYVKSIFSVVTIALLASWVVAVVFTPSLGYALLPQRDGREAHDPYASPFYRRFRRLVGWCVDRRRVVIVATAIAFAIGVFGLRFVQQQFFPASVRPELMVDLTLPEGASYAATEGEVKRLEARLAKDPDVRYFVAYVGSGSPRYYLPLDQQLPKRNFAQFMVMSPGGDRREALKARLERLLAEEFPLVRGRVGRLENGPPLGYPIQFRVAGYEPARVQGIAKGVARIMEAHPNTSDVNFDWNETVPVVRLEVDQDKARALGINSQDLSRQLSALLTGIPVTSLRDGDELVDVVLRAAPGDRQHLERLRDIGVYANGRQVPLTQVVRLSTTFEDGTIWRRNRFPTVTVRADLRGNAQAPTVSKQIDAQLAALRATLPVGYRIEVGGAAEASAVAQRSIAAVGPLALVIMVTLLMLQLKSFQKTLLVLLTAPLGLIGVSLVLAVFRVPFGFVAMLGALSLAGMIMRNSVILVDQVDQDLVAGRPLRDAIIESTVRRFRPIVLTALAAILAMIPLTRSGFWGPMAWSIMGGLSVATVLTCLFLPALYAAWYRVPLSPR